MSLHKVVARGKQGDCSKFHFEMSLKVVARGEQMVDQNVTSKYHFVRWLQKENYQYK